MSKQPKRSHAGIQTCTQSRRPATHSFPPAHYNTQYNCIQIPATRHPSRTIYNCWILGLASYTDLNSKTCTHARTYAHTRNVHVCTHIQCSTHTGTLTCCCTIIPGIGSKPAPGEMHLHIHISTRARTHTHTHTHTHAHTHIHTHTPAAAPSFQGTASLDQGVA